MQKKSDMQKHHIMSRAQENVMLFWSLSSILHRRRPTRKYSSNNFYYGRSTLQSKRHQTKKGGFSLVVAIKSGRQPSTTVVDH
jgi:hypothetical protein